MSKGIPVQLPLSVKLNDEATLNNFFIGPNGQAVTAVETLADPHIGPVDFSLYLWGSAGSGRSHLLQAACHRMAEADCASRVDVC